MGSLPFSLYDFFGYLAAGTLYLMAAEYALGSTGLLQKEPPVALQAFWLMLAYAVGHINAHWSSWLIEGKLARRLGLPSKTLFTPSAPRLFKHYRSPLPAGTATAILDKYERMTGSRQAGEAMFLYCYHQVKERCPQANVRLGTFTALYGFSRNLSYAAMVVAIAVAITADGSFDRLLVAGLAVVASVTLFFRYLKFYRAFSIEVFTSYLTCIEEAVSQTPAPRGSESAAVPVA